VFIADHDVVFGLSELTGERMKHYARPVLVLMAKYGTFISQKGWLIATFTSVIGSLRTEFGLLAKFVARILC